MRDTHTDPKSRVQTHHRDQTRAMLDILVVPFYVLYEMVTAFWINMTYGLFVKRKLLRGKTALVTGAAMGIGRSVAIEFSKHGVDLVLWDIEDDLMEETAEMCRKNGVKVDAFHIDCSLRTEVEKGIKLTKRALGFVHILFNNAGIVNQKYFLHKTDELMEKTITVNALSHIWIVRGFLPEMLARNDGHIVCNASIAGLFGTSGMTDYTFSKAAAISFQESLETECKVLNKEGVKFTTVCQGYIATRLNVSTNIPAAASHKKMTCDYAAYYIVDAIRMNQSMLMQPRKIYLIHALKGVLPRRLYQRLIISIFFGEQFHENRRNPKLASYHSTPNAKAA